MLQTFFADERFIQFEYLLTNQKFHIAIITIGRLHVFLGRPVKPHYSSFVMVTVWMSSAFMSRRLYSRLALRAKPVNINVLAWPSGASNTSSLCSSAGLLYG